MLDTVFTFSRRHLIWAAFILCIEIAIARYIHGGWIRTFGGDALVTVLLYSMLKSVVRVPALSASLLVFAFAVMIEVLQYFHLPILLGLESNRLAVIVLGATFDPQDILAYGIGCCVAWRFIK